MARSLVVWRSPAWVRTVKAGSEFLRREVVLRRLPHGLVHWRYAARNPPVLILRQRSLWLASRRRMPFTVWLALEFFLWMRWQAWEGHKNALRALRRFGGQVKSEEGVGLFRQFCQTEILSAAYCIPPFEAYRYHLHRRSNRRQALEYVFENSRATFHSLRNGESSEAYDSLRLLSDKENLSSALSSLGLSTARNLTVARRGTRTDLSDHIESHGAVFCKPLHGHGGRGAFEAYHDDCDLVIVPLLEGRKVIGPHATAYWHRLLDQDDMLVQTRLSNHSIFAGIHPDELLVTIRYISQFSLGLDPCYCATVEVPVYSEDSRRVFSVLEVDAETGAIGGFPPGSLFRKQDDRNRPLLEKLGGKQVPFWDDLRQGSQVAHSLVPSIYAVAWDWAVTPDGPVLLEGNSGWGLVTPQVLKGGLLAACDAPLSGGA
jgi:hypothetical protein